MGCGRMKINRFHFLLFITWQLTIYFAVQQLFPIFANYTPNWRCSNDTEYAKNCSLLKECPKELLQFDHMPFYSTVLEFDMLCGTRAYIASLISTFQFGGVLLGTIVFGQLADKYGRRPIALITLTFGVFFTMLSGASPNWQILMALRILVGTCIGGAIVSVYTYVVEIIPPQQRVFLRAFFNWGYSRVMLTIVCWMIPHWRWASYATVSFVVPLIPIIYFLLPESPTWLMSKERFTEMEQSEQKISKFANSPTMFEAQNSQEKKVLKPQRQYTIRDLFANRLIAKRTLILWLIWFTAALCSYVNDLNSRNLAGDFFANQLLMGSMTGMCQAIIYLLDTYIPGFSRRMLYQASQSLVIGCFATMTLLMIFVDAPIVILVIDLVGTVLISYTWDACFLCAAEGFPTEVRAMGIGTCASISRIGALLAPQVAFLGTLWQPTPFLTVFLLGTITLSFSIIFLPETKGTDLKKCSEILTTNVKSSKVHPVANTSGQQKMDC
uniref:Major facilitator superfamily (MFS) profile domain-containing protein n=1 Tax=Plectus sambesii TaxID=2011161 RepID=A0A914V6F7_9BILA